MTTRELIIRLIKNEKESTATGIAKAVGISKQAISRHLRALIKAGLVKKEGTTRGARFKLSKGDEVLQPPAIQKKLTVRGLEEDRVFEDFASRLSLRQRLSEEAFEAVNYAFTEILNNTIEHSQSPHCVVKIEQDAHDLIFQVRDFGIGIFYSIFSKFGLEDEEAAVSELLKGKATTMKERHSGEGLFFTSKVADRFVLKSHRIQLSFDSKKDDVQVEAVRHIKGTDVRFELSMRSRKKLETLFQKFAPEEFDFAFERTRVWVRLIDTRCVSRSEAKRLIARLHEFKEVVLDFKEVVSLGQAFADEVFRVFLRTHTDVHIQLENLQPSLVPMVKHATDEDTAARVHFVS